MASEVIFKVVPAVNLSDSLHDIFGFAEFRPLQEDAIAAALEGRDVLVVMPTGAGKSLCFQLPAALTPGVTLVISPLIALMRDQIIGLLERTKYTEIGAAYLNSSQSPDEQRDILTLLRAGKLKLLYVAPERLRSPGFAEALKSVQIARFVVDEAHCISEWGHDFRPDYLAIKGFIEQLGNPPILAVTATATRRVQDSIVQNLGMREPEIFVGGFNRPNLHFSVHKCKNDNERKNLLWKALPKLVGRGGSGLIYAGTRKTCEEVGELASKALAPLGKRAGVYHAGLDVSTREAMQSQWLSGEMPVLVATNAFGMGIDKPDVRFVIHYTFPESPEAYYQEAGRAGRDGKKSRCVILYHFSDRKLREFFIDNEALTLDDLKSAHRKLATLEDGPVRVPKTFFERELGWRELKTRVVLGRLERAGAIERLGETGDVLLLRVLQRALSGPLLGRMQREIEAERAERMARLEEMVSFCRSRTCRRRQMLDYFGDDDLFDNSFCCDNCDSPQIDAPPIELPQTAVQMPQNGVRDIYDLLQALDALYPKVGKTRLVKLLRGSQAADAKKFVNSPIFASLPGVSATRILEFLNDLSARGFLHQGEEEEYPVCRVTLAGRETWQTRAPLDFDLPGRAKTPSSGLSKSSTSATPISISVVPTLDSLEDGEGEIFEKLRSWRRRQAGEENLPPYCVFSDKVLLQIARQQPESENDLRGISGVGESKIAKYGAQVLEILKS